MNLFTIDEIVAVIVRQIGDYRDLLSVHLVNRRFHTHAKKVPFTHTRTLHSKSDTIRLIFLLGNILWRKVMVTPFSKTILSFRDGRLVGKEIYAKRYFSISLFQGKWREHHFSSGPKYTIDRYHYGTSRYRVRYFEGTLESERFSSQRVSKIPNVIHEPVRRYKEIAYRIGLASSVTISNGVFPLKSILLFPEREVTLVAFHRKHPREWTCKDVADWFIFYLRITTPPLITGEELLSLSDTEFRARFFASEDEYRCAFYYLQACS